jgi:anti-anti-sigma factor
MVITDTLAHLDATHLRVTLVPSGEIDAGNVGSLAESIHDALRSGAHEIDLDLAAVPFLDSAAVEVLEGARDSLEAIGGHLCVRNPMPPVRRLLSLTAFTPSRAEAHG